MTTVKVSMTVVAGLAAAIFAAFSVGNRGEPELWLQDFDKLERELAAGYANLEWTAKRHDLDLAELSRDAKRTLSDTSSRRGAQKTIQRFLESFHDPHLRAEKSDPPAADPASGTASTGPSGTASAADALEAFGYRVRKQDFGIDFPAIPGFEVLDSGDNPFPAGVLKLADGRKLGVVRIEHFGEDSYYDVAERTWNTFKSDVECTII